MSGGLSENVTAASSAAQVESSAPGKPAPLLEFVGADGARVPLLEGTNPVAIEVPEMLSFVEQLGANVGLKSFKPGPGGGTVNGSFVPAEKGKIWLSRELFGNPDQLAKTLAHEIGHLLDWFGNVATGTHGTMARGNLLGRLATLAGFRREALPKLDMLSKIPGGQAAATGRLSADELAAIYRDARLQQAMKRARPKDPAQAELWDAGVAAKFSDTVRELLGKVPEVVRWQIAGVATGFKACRNRSLPSRGAWIETKISMSRAKAASLDAKQSPAGNRRV